MFRRLTYLQTKETQTHKRLSLKQNYHMHIYHIYHQYSINKQIFTQIYNGNINHQSKQVDPNDYKYSLDINDMDFDINSLGDRLVLKNW